MLRLATATRLVLRPRTTLGRLSPLAGPRSRLDPAPAFRSANNASGLNYLPSRGYARKPRTGLGGMGGGSGGPELPSLPPGAPLPLLLGLALAGAALLMLMAGSSQEQNDIQWATFKRDYLPYGRNYISKLVILRDQERAVVHLTGVNGQQQTLTMSVGDVDNFHEKFVEAQNEVGIDIWDRIPITYVGDSLGRTFFQTVPSLMWSGLFAYMAFIIVSTTKTVGGAAGGAGGIGGIFGMQKSKAKLITADMKPDVNFSKVAGLEEAKVEIMEFVEFLKTPARFTALGAKIPRGALLAGPPGTGKTLLAKACAGEAGVPFFTASGSDFMEMFVGVGPARVRDLFAQARKKAPCIVFIDEIDAIGRKREASSRMSHDERENTLNQLLVEMDGFDTKSGVIVLAGTNRPDVLDSALLRPGRFDRTINIDPPDLKGRKEILKNLKLEEGGELDKYAEHIATLTPGMVGADLANICNEAALIAARLNKDAVQTVDLENAIDRVVGGLEKKNKVLSPKDKIVVAYHEAGHAVVGWLLEHANPLLKVSIIPRGSNALGYAQYQPQDRHLYTPSQLLDQMCVMLGGRIAESLVFKTISTGASDDLERVTKLAYDEVTRLGMSKSIGNLSFKPPQSDFPQERIYSQKLSKEIDDEVKRIVEEAYSRAEKVLKENFDDFVKVADRLMQKEKISKDDMVEILGERKWRERRSYKDLLFEDEKELKELEDKERAAEQ